MMKKLLIILGFPLWFPLLIAMFAVAFSVCLSLWAAFLSVFACGAAGVIGCIGYVSVGYQLLGLVFLGTGIVCFGLSILLFFVSKASTKGAIWLSKKVVLGS